MFCCLVGDVTSCWRELSFTMSHSSDARTFVTVGDIEVQLMDGMLKSPQRITGHDSECENIVDQKCLRSVR